MTQPINARDIIVQVSDGAVSPTWYGIARMKSIKPDFSEGEEVADLTNNDSGGNYEGRTMQRGAKIDIEALKSQDPVTGTKDPGQAMIETIGQTTGASAVIPVRFRHPGESEWSVWEDALVSLKDQGGGTNDPSAWNCTLTRSGPTTDMAVV